MTNDQSDLWEIYILANTGQRSLMVINKNESVANLFKKIREKCGGFESGKRLTLLPADGSELQENDHRRLVDCIGDKCSIRLIVGLHPDGVECPTKMEVTKSNVVVPPAKALKVADITLQTTDLEKRTTLKTKLPWQIFVLMDTTNKVQVTVSENCLISELLKKIKEHPHIPKGRNYRLYTSDGKISQNYQTQT